MTWVRAVIDIEQCALRTFECAFLAPLVVEQHLLNP
jgi:hypothetical protein